MAPKETLRHVLEALKALDTHQYFHFPVSREVTGYYDVIKRPVDFSKMEKKLEKYGHLGELKKDFELMIANCQLFNLEQSAVFKESERLYKKGMVVIQKAERDGRKGIGSGVEYVGERKRGRYGSRDGGMKAGNVHVYPWDTVNKIDLLLKRRIVFDVSMGKKRKRISPSVSNLPQGSVYTLLEKKSKQMKVLEMSVATACYPIVPVKSSRMHNIRGQPVPVTFDGKKNLLDFTKSLKCHSMTMKKLSALDNFPHIRSRTSSDYFALEIPEALKEKVKTLGEPPGIDISSLECLSSTPTYQ